MPMFISFYPRSRIESKLRMISDGTITREPIPKEKILPLCLYLIESDFHFTGDGIWADQHAEER